MTKKEIGSDCKYCYLDGGVYCLVYFCKYKSSKESRVICDDGFTHECQYYKPLKKKEATERKK